MNLTWVLLPGAILHEYTHAAVASPWASTSIEWVKPIPWAPLRGGRVRMEWPADAPQWALTASLVAPLVIGLWISPAVYYGAMWALSERLPLALVGWLVLNWLVYTGISAQDINAAAESVRGEAI